LQGRAYQDVLLYHLFDLIDTLTLQLNIKKRHPIDIFVKADLHTLSFFEEDEEIFRQLFFLNSFSFIKFLDNEPQGFYIDQREEFTLGIKKADPSPEQKSALETYEEEYQRLNEYLEYLRTMLATYGSSADKQQEMLEIKERRDELMLQIQKLRAK
jgi:hypothetical protein